MCTSQVALAALFPKDDAPMPHAVPLCHLPLATAIFFALSTPVLAGTPSPTQLDRVQVKVSTATRSERLLADVPIRTEVLRRRTSRCVRPPISPVRSN